MDTLDSSHEWLVQVLRQQHKTTLHNIIHPARNTFAQVSQESLRLAQQSITLRKAMAPFEFVSERGSCRCCK